MSGISPPPAVPDLSAETTVRHRAWIAVAVLLVLYAVQALWFSRVKGSSFDEGEELFTGYNIWLRGDFRMEGANGDFVKRWATLPLLVTRPHMVSTADPAWRAGDPYWAGFRFLFESGNDADAILLQGRCMIVLLGMATGLLVFWGARELFGWGGGVFALGVFVFSPNMLAFGGLVSTEMSLCLAMLGALQCIWRLLHRITWGRIAASLAFFALLVLSKPTAVLMLPATALVFAVRFFGGRPLVIALGKVDRTIPARRAQVKWFLLLTLAHAAVGYTAIWAHYDFRFAASPNPNDAGISYIVNPQRDPIAPEALVVLRAAQDHHVLPESFIRGVRYLLGHDESRHAFLAGEWTYGGWHGFFLRAAIAKTRPALLAFIVIGIGWWVGRSWRARRRVVADAPLPAFYALTPYLSLFAVYVPAAVLQELNIGHRHILPLYPLGYLLTGVNARVWQAGGRWTRSLISALCAWLIVETLAIAPHYLAYFSPLVGGPRKGYTQLVDSSLDWGGNLPSLKRWLDRNNPNGREPVYLAYFGTDSPAYRGIAAHRLPGFFDWGRGEQFPLEPGLYAISATLLQTVYTRTFGPWNKVYEHDYQELLKQVAVFEKTARDPAARQALIGEFSAEAWVRAYESFENLRFGRLCAWLRHHGEPTDNVGYAILIWRLDAAQIQDALYGPPAELAEEPVRP